jgi:uncharacterized membrane protein YgaE (UPF0421/DUF939 family)
MVAQNNSNEENNISELGNVDQIREILFGSQSRELKEKFDKLEEHIKSIQTEMRSKIEQSQQDFTAKIDDEIEALSKKMKNITTQQQDEFADVRDSALKQEKRIQNSMEIMEEELNSKREQLQKQQIETRDALRSQMDTLRDELIQIIDAKISELSENKLSRDDAADIFMEAAMQMKGTGIDKQLSMTSKK